MSGETTRQEELYRARLRDIKQDIQMIESKKERLDADKAALVLKLIAQMEQLLALEEQDE